VGPSTESGQLHGDDGLRPGGFDPRHDPPEPRSWGRGSRAPVSRVTNVLGEQGEQLRRTPIEGPIPYLYLDAAFLDAHWARTVENVWALVAYRVDGTGHRRRHQVPEALRCLEKGFAASTQFYAFAREHWVRIRSTNGLERLYGGVKRRTRSIGAFPDRDSAVRLVTAVALETAHVWADRRCLDMSLLKAEQPTATAPRLPAPPPPPRSSPSPRRSPRVGCPSS
jgi:transposase-like protein